MGFMDNLKKRMTGAAGEDDNYNDDYFNDSDIYSDDDQDESGGMSSPSSRDSGYSNVNAGVSPMGAMGMNQGISLSGAAIEMKVVKPEHFDSVPQIADHLLNKRTVVLNLENTNKETSRRLIDFLSGVAYSIDGSLKKIASNAYVITPSNVEVGDAKLASKAAASAPKPEETENSDASAFGEF